MSDYHYDTSSERIVARIVFGIYIVAYIVLGILTYTISNPQIEAYFRKAFVPIALGIIQGEISTFYLERLRVRLRSSFLLKKVLFLSLEVTTRISNRIIALSFIILSWLIIYESPVYMHAFQIKFSLAITILFALKGLRYVKLNQE
jgi:hypothetical protein